MGLPGATREGVPRGPQTAGVCPWVENRFGKAQRVPHMGLDELEDEVSHAYSELDGVDDRLDAESRTELAMLMAALEADDPDTLLNRAIHLLFQQTVDTGKLDFHLRRRHDITYDEYLSGMTYDEMAGGMGGERDDDRRYQF